MSEQNNDMPIIKTFMYKGGFYCYDAFTNQLFRVSKDQFVEIKQLQKIGKGAYIGLNKNSQPYKDIRMLMHRGLISTSFIKQIEHPMTKYVECLVDRCVSYLILQVTCDCNFDCRYCLFASDSSSEIERGHRRKKMSWDVAKKSIDFFYSHSNDVKEIKLAFYGGEPLLNFNLIKKAVDYAETLFVNKKIKYFMTTNASLLNDEIISFLISHEFNLTLSFDGPKDIQDKHRKFSNTGKGSYEVVWKNINKIKQKNQSFFESKIIFHPVMFIDESIDKIMSFFTERGISKENVIPQYADTQGIDYTICYLDYKKQKENDLIKQEFEKQKEIFAQKTKISPIWHHCGPCVPGVLRLFVDIEGHFYPCEKNNSFVKIGSLSDGLDVSKVKEILNIAILTEEECKKCWAIRFCSMCVNQCLDISENKIAKQIKLSNCNIQKKSAESFLKKFIDQN